MKRKRIIAITGGIGAGKSVVSLILRNAGYGVYDCDAQAKQIMNESTSIRKALVQEFGPDVYDASGVLNRQALSSIIFKDNDALLFVNSIVHPAVRDDIAQWTNKQHGQIVFIETAILKEGGLDDMVHEVWNVVAPLELRIKRVMARNNASREQVTDRIKSQSDNCSGITKPITEIINDGTTALLPQIVTMICSM